MAKVQKAAALMKVCVKKPKTFLKGIKYFAKYGYVGMRQNMKARADFELNQSGKPFSGQSAEESDGFPALPVIKGDILFSVIMPVYNVKVKWLKRAIASVEHQIYDNWELCIVDDCSTSESLRKYLKSLDNEKIKVKFLEKNKGISGATNEAAAMAKGEYLVLLDNDDELSVEALIKVYEAFLADPADIFYSDMDIVDENGVHSAPFCKPDWSPDLFLSQMYLGHLVCVRRELYEKVGGCNSEFDGSQDYDLLLRMTEKTDRICHIDKVLYSWRSLPTSTAANAQSKPYAQIAGQKAVQEHLNRVLGEGKAEVRETENLFVYDVRYQLEQLPKASIIIPTKDHKEDLENALNSIFQKTTYPNYEIIILNNNSEEQETFAYLESLSESRDNVQVLDASYPFNWSKLNNQGIRAATGEVMVCLNNDVMVIEPEWLTRLVEKAMQSHVGTVGGLLLYPDDTIQHAGVVVAMNGWADHIFKGMKPVHCGTPYVSPMVPRNVSACTGACLAFQKSRVEELGGFDERFIICGSDVELSLRFMQNGYYNVYDPGIRLYHYESKSRDSYIPEIDFTLSSIMYRVYREKGDPFYNKQLDYTSCVPKVAEKEQFDQTRIQPLNVQIAELEPMRLRVEDYPERRLNLLVPSINKEHVFGGISTALKFFEALSGSLGYATRMILTDAQPSDEARKQYEEAGYEFVLPGETSKSRKQIVPFSKRNKTTLGVSEKDYFIQTGWWTAYNIQDGFKTLLKKEKIKVNPFIYFIQDYEPGFYAWSSRYLLSDSTYRSDFKQIAIFNSHELRVFFNERGYKFEAEMEFNPLLNQVLKSRVQQMGEVVHKKKQILVYGRPGTDRNAFELVVYALRRFVEISDIAKEWTFYSAGERHNPVSLGKGKYLHSLGKMSLEEYTAVLEETYAGISLMVSPHPSYPPLEMAVFDVNVITNGYENKDLSDFNPHITSVNQPNPLAIAESLEKICETYRPVVPHVYVDNGYCSDSQPFPFLEELKQYL